MSDREVKRLTPNSIANLVMEDEAWHDSLYVKAEDYDSLLADFEALRTALAAEPTKPKQEPVAVFDEQMGHPVLLLGSPMLKDKQPLYTAPSALAAEQPKPVRLHATTTGVLLGSAWLVWNTPKGANDEIMSQETANLLNRMFAENEALRRDAFRKGFYAGFAATGEGWNGEYPFQDKNRPIAGDPSVEAAIDAAMGDKR